MVLDRVFTEEEMNDIMFDGAVYDEDEVQLFEVVSETFIDSNNEKGSVTKDYVIKDCINNKHYKARLSESPWIYQTEANCEVMWEEVFPKKIITEVYE